MASYKGNPNDYRLRQLLHSRFKRTDDRRNPSTVHVSMLTDQTSSREYCPRESALSYKNDLDAGSSWISTAMAMTFDIGNFVHNNIVQHLLPFALGEWLCPDCLRHWRGEYRKCKCGSEPEYTELFFRSPVSGVVGSLDMVVDLNFPKHVIVEMKTLEKDKFRELGMPINEHRQRVLGYLKLLREANEVDPWIGENIMLDVGYVLYISKGMGHYFKKKGMGGVTERYSPFQEFPVYVEDNGAWDHVEEMFQRASVYWDWKKAPFENALPNRIFNCNQSECKRAENCVARKVCWNGK